MQTVIEFRDSLVEYLQEQKRLEQKDIEHNEHLSDDDKIAAGLLIKDAMVVSCHFSSCEIETSVDNTRLKPGDYVVIHCGSKSADAQVIDTGIGTLTIDTLLHLQNGQSVNVEIKEGVFLDSIISVLKNITEDGPGSSLLRQLAGLESPSDSGIGRINIDDVYVPENLNDRQMQVITDVMKRPSVYCIQGPPGTGKTAVLASIASAYASTRKEVLIISNTHQAVNNALNKVFDIDSYVNITKIGQSIKSEGLDSNITIAETYNDYLKSRKKNKNSATADIVGMTLHAAIVNLGLRNSGFQPQVILVDEAGQMPLTYASAIGAFGCGSIIFIGDDNQMPPIFHPELQQHPYSKSIFAYLCSIYPELRKTLNITYRMNDTITKYISRKFYECHGENQAIVSSEFSKDRLFPIQYVGDNAELNKALSPDISIYSIYDKRSDICQEQNAEEAETAFTLADLAIRHGLSASDIAIITPFRKQVKAIRSVFHSHHYDIASTPLINTVECLQGQDVEMIIISFASTDKEYIKQHYDFILDRHRLNVMISRAKTKVVMLMGEYLKTMM